MGSVRESTDAMADAPAAPELGVDNAVGVPAPARPMPNEMPGTPPGPPPVTPPKGDGSEDRGFPTNWPSLFGRPFRV